MIIIYYTKLDAFLWKNIKHKINILSVDGKDRLMSLRHDIDRCRTLCGKILLLHLLQQYTKWDINALPELKYNKYGKPYLSKLGGYFNISHSGSYIICAYSPDINIGIDIEEITEIDIDEYAQVLTYREYEYLRNGNNQDFFKLWTIKEAVMKADGRGFSLDPRTIDLMDDEKTITLGNNIWHILQLEIDIHYKSYLASGVNTEPIIEEISPESLT